jgi:hypothetical protein
MINLFVITSVINISNGPFTYTDIRSLYTCEERFEQTKQTIQTIKEKVPNVKILHVECSNINSEQQNYIINNVDYFINLYDDEYIRNIIDGKSKSMGENTLLLNAINYIKFHDIEYDNFYKISGRYFLNDQFNYDNYNNDKLIYSDTKTGCDYDIHTSLYKIPKSYVTKYYKYIIDNINSLEDGFCAELFYGLFLKNHVDSEYKIKVDKLGVSGKVAVFNHYANF